MLARARLPRAASGSLRRIVVSAVAALVVACLPSVVTAGNCACPFCASVAQTLGEEIATNDVVVICKMVDPGPLTDDSSDSTPITQVTRAEFEVIQVLKGDDFHTVGSKFETVVFGNVALEDTFMVMGIDPPRTVWSTPIRVNEREVEYVTVIPTLPLEGPERLEYFMHHLEDSSSMLAADAYDEFARAPYEDVIALKPVMAHDKLVRWIQDPDVSASRKRLYLVMLGICGDKKDLPMLEEILQSPDRRRRSGLDAMIACYLTLKGEAGLPLIEELFLSNDEAEYADTYAAITALRFHGTEEDILSKDRILDAMELMLRRPRLADLVIPDLARWEDWEVMDELVQLFKDADADTNWVRVPVVNYLRACPLPEAKRHLEELEAIDPDAIRRANNFFPLPSDDDFGDDWEDTDDKGDSDDTGDSDDGTSDDASTGDTNAGDGTQSSGSDAGSNGNDTSDDNLPVNESSCTDESQPVDPATIASDASTDSASEPIEQVESQKVVVHEPVLDKSDVEFVTTLTPSVGDEASNEEQEDGAEQLLASNAPQVATTTSSSMSLISVMLTASLACVAVFFVLWGLMTGRLVRMMS